MHEIEGVESVDCMPSCTNGGVQEKGVRKSLLAVAAEMHTQP